MKSIDSTKPLVGGEQKIQEYVDRIRNGESEDSIFQGLPASFKSGIEKRLAEQNSEVNEGVLEETNGVPPQYRGLDSETLDFIWTIPEYVDPEKTKAQKEKKARVLASLREKESTELAKEERQKADKKRIGELRQGLGVTQPIVGAKAERQVENQLISIDERKKLYGWWASYELAKVAKQQGIDLSQISREDYVEFAIQNSLAIDDSQLRMPPWQRMCISAQEIVSVNKEKKSKINKGIDQSFEIFSRNIQQKAGEKDRVLQEGIKVRQGTKDSNSWLFFGINKSLGGNRGETFKSYVSVKDLNILTPERFMQLMIALKDAGYNGDIKIFQDLSGQGINLNDQIVMHGASQADAKLALQVAEKFFGADLDQKSIGKDEVINGEEKSYSQILAEKIKDAVKPTPQKLI